MQGYVADLLKGLKELMMQVPLQAQVVGPALEQLPL